MFKNRLVKHIPDFVGLTGTLMSLLNFLNLAELGISTAIGYVLYKPIFEHDETLSLIHI